MLMSLLIQVLVSNATTLNKKKSILYSRIAIQGLILVSFIAYNNLHVKSLVVGIGVYGGLFNVTAFTQTFNIFVLLITGVILILNAFYPLFVTSNDDNMLHYEPFSKTSVSYENTEILPVEENKGTRYNLLYEPTYHPHFIYNGEETLLGDQPEEFSIIEYPLIIIFILFGGILLMSTGDLISLFLAIELQSYGLYILCTLYRDSESATGSGLIYFLLGGLSSCFILFGSSLLYVNSGTTNLDNIYIMISISEVSNTVLYWYQPYYIQFSLIVLTVGFLFKISAAPFHFWSPDVYDGIPTVVTTFVAIVTKISIFVFLLGLVLYTEYDHLNLSFILPESTKEFTGEHYDKSTALSLIPLTLNNDTFLSFTWKNILIFSSLMSLVIGSVLGLTQYRIKRLFAYSTISHVGFILLALCVNKTESVQAYIFYIIQYSLSNLNAFMLLIAIGNTLYFYVYKKKSTQINLIDINNSPLQLINQIKGFFYINSFMSISFAITLFSFVGIPPLIGFFAKQMVLSSALDEGYLFMTLVGIITSVIGAVYYLNIVKLMFFTKNDNEKGELLSSMSYNTLTTSAVSSITISVLTNLILLFIFVPGEWFNIISILSLTLFKA